MTTRALTRDEKKALQTRLTEAGFYTEPIDGIYGQKTREGVRLLQEDLGYEPTGLPTFDLLVEIGVFTPPPKPKGLFTMQNNWFSGIVGSTAFKYLVAMVATFIASKIGLEQGSVEGILTQIIALAMAVWGMYSASQSKSVVNGQVVKLADMPASDQRAVIEAVAEAKGVTPTALVK